MIARPTTVALPTIEGATVVAARWGGAGDGNRTRIASLEGCVYCAVRGLDPWSDRVTVLRY
jgi:hypothetical protein